MPVVSRLSDESFGAGAGWPAGAWSMIGLPRLEVEPGMCWVDERLDMSSPRRREAVVVVTVSLTARGGLLDRRRREWELSTWLVGAGGVGDLECGSVAMRRLGGPFQRQRDATQILAVRHRRLLRAGFYAGAYRAPAAAGVCEAMKLRSPSESVPR